MNRDRQSCPDCSSSADRVEAISSVNRRDFLRTAGAVGAAASVGSLGLWTPVAFWRPMPQRRAAQLPNRS